MKIGRNSPCPCGSGKKYKRCCLAKSPKASSPKAGTGAGAKGKGAPVHPPGFPSDPFADLSAYAIARMFEKTKEFGKLRKCDPDLWRMITAPGVASLTTAQIQQRLAAMGIDASRDAFLALATKRSVAWDIATQWLEGRGEVPSWDEDFAGLAACELWKRFCPERPSIEMLDDWMQEGYSYDGEGQMEKACDVWWRVWQELRSRFTAAMRTTKQAQVTFRGQQFIYNWTQDFIMSLQNASYHDPAYVERGIDYLRQLLEQFPGEDDLYRANAQSDLGELLCRAGRADAGIRVLEELIREYPDQVVGYCRLAEEFTEKDPRRAIALLEKARDRPVEDVATWDLGPRIEELRRKLASG